MSCASLPYMSISAGVVRAIALQQIDHAPHAEASAEGNNEGLQSVDGRRKELHIASISPGNTRTLKKPPIQAATYTSIIVRLILSIRDEQNSDLFAAAHNI